MLELLQMSHQSACLLSPMMQLLVMKLLDMCRYSIESNVQLLPRFATSCSLMKTVGHVSRWCSCDEAAGHVSPFCKKWCPVAASSTSCSLMQGCPHLFLLTPHTYKYPLRTFRNTHGNPPKKLNPSSIYLTRIGNLKVKDYQHGTKTKVWSG